MRTPSHPNPKPVPPADPGSFRDPSSRVLLEDDRVVRLLDGRGLEAWRALSATEFFSRSVREGRLVQSIDTKPPTPEAAGALEHPRLPLITFPYEWTFSMLKDAALLHLDLMEEALEAGLTMKDATPFNIQFLDGSPIFIDVGSFQPYLQGEPWIGYRQFTRQFLFPLMLRAWLGIPFQPWLRGNMDGPTPGQMRQVLPLRHRLRPGAVAHVTLQARMEARMSGQAVRGDLRGAGFSKELIVANLRRLRKLIESLHWQPSRDGWSGYGAQPHVERDREAKSEFLSSMIETHRPSRVLDLGANDGHYSSLAADSGALAMATDSDEPVLDGLYLRSGGRTISTILCDVADPSPGQGWVGAERPGLWKRTHPDLVVAYGLVHHLVYTASIPPEKVADWLRSFDCPVALELVTPEDEMVALLTTNKEPEELHPGRSEVEWRATLGQRFDIRSSTRLSATRVLLELQAR